MIAKSNHQPRPFTFSAYKNAAVKDRVFVALILTGIKLVVIGPELILLVTKLVVTYANP